LRAHGGLDNLPPTPGNGAVRDEQALVAMLAAVGFADAKEQIERVELGYRDVETCGLRCGPTVTGAARTFVRRSAGDIQGYLYRAGANPGRPERAA